MLFKLIQGFDQKKKKPPRIVVYLLDEALKSRAGEAATQGTNLAGLAER